MISYELLRDVMTLRASSSDKYIDHVKTCVMCINEDECVDERTFIDILDLIDVIYAKYVETETDTDITFKI